MGSTGNQFSENVQLPKLILACFPVGSPEPLQGFLWPADLLRLHLSGDQRRRTLHFLKWDVRGMGLQDHLVR